MTAPPRGAGGHRSAATAHRPSRLHGLLGGATALLLVAGLVVGCSAAGSGGGGATPTAAPPAAGSDVPVLTGAPDAASVPAPSWQMGQGTGDPLVGFKDTPYNNAGAQAPTVVAAPDVPGRRALRFEVPAGGQRSELEPDVPVYQEDDEAWFGFAWSLPQDFPTSPEGFQILAQWKNGGEGSPPLEIKTEGGEFRLDGGAGGENPRANYFSVPIGPARAGQQTDVVVHVIFSTDPTKAVVDVWMNGQQRIAGYRPPAGTRYESDDSYLKTGIYRDTANTADAVVTLVDARIAASYPSAAALAGPRAGS